MLRDGSAEPNLGNAVELAPDAINQQVRCLDVQLDPDAAPVWSVVYLPPLARDGFVGVPAVAQVLGRLVIGQGGVATSEVHFDWGAGGILTVPACSLQVDVLWRPNDIGTFPQAQAPPPGPYQAWCVPGAVGNAQPNTLTRRLGPVPVFPAFVDVPIPPMARRFSAFTSGLVFTGGANVYNIFFDCFDSAGTRLYRRFAPGNSSLYKQQAPLDELLPGGAARHSISRTAVPAGSEPDNVCLVYTLGV